MAGRVDVAKGYLLSVVERAIGVNAYQRWQTHAEQDFKPSTEAYNNRRSSGVFVGLIQFILPAMTDSMARICSAESPKNLFIEMAKYGLIQPTIDGTSWMLMGTTDNLLQFALYKVASNAVTHVGLDLAGAAMKRIKSFRSSATTLAV